MTLLALHRRKDLKSYCFTKDTTKNIEDIYKVLKIKNLLVKENFLKIRFFKNIFQNFCSRNFLKIKKKIR